MFSGHQSFSLRIAWLPKSVNAVAEGKDPFRDPRVGTQLLGLGKNMVESLSYWVEFFGVIEFDDKLQPKLTEFGKQLMGNNGLDPFLEDDQTLWLLHWKGTAAAPRKYFAWHWLFNLHYEHEFTYADALREFKLYAEKLARPLSDTTVRQHLDVFLGTYVASTPDEGEVAEDLLDSPLASLGLIRESDLRDASQGKNMAYVVDSGPKPTISDELFRYTLHDWWGRYAKDQTVSYREICVAENSPGRVLRLPERDIFDRLQRLVMEWPKEFQLKESNNQRLVQRMQIPSSSKLLDQVYDRSA
jgi:hypothetical protein